MKTQRIRLSATAAAHSETNPLTPSLNDTPPPKVLVLLAAFNGGAWIAEQVQSILSQRDVDLRLLIRDDCSTDQTCAKIEPFLKDSRVHLIRGQTPTGSAAQNYFELIRARSAEGFDFISLSDQDDEWNTDKMSRACARLRGSHSSGYSSATIARWGNGKTKLLTQNHRTTPGDFLFGGIGQGCTFVMTADFYERAREFLLFHQVLTKHIHYHDWALYALARSWDLAWVFDPVPTVYYRQHASNDTGARKSIAGLRKRLTRICSGWYSGQLHAITEMCLMANPTNRVVSTWNTIFSRPKSWARRIRIATFCFHSGRRDALDNAALISSALLGWI